MIQHPTSPVRSATGLQIWADADWQARNNTAPAKAGQMRPMIASARCSGQFGDQPAISRRSVGGLSTLRLVANKNGVIWESPLWPRSGRSRRPMRGGKTLVALMPDDLRHLGCRRRIAAALRADDAVDDGHADAGEIAKLHAVKNVLSGGMLRLVHDDKVSRSPDFDNAAVQRAHSRRVAGGEAERDLRGHLTER